VLSRRRLLKYLTAGSAVAAAPTLAFADADTDARLVLIVLRGAADGLAIAPPFGDPEYRSLRGELALARPGDRDGMFDLDGFFGLHPRLETLHGLFQSDEALIVHAVASPYRSRSHFDGQDMLENGGQSVGAERDGWLNRALPPLGGGFGNAAAIALAQNPPLVLRGAEAVNSWAPSRLDDADTSTIERLKMLYSEDSFFAERLDQAIKSQNIASAMDGSAARVRAQDQFRSSMETAGRFLTADDGPRIAVLEAGGWDTHANQGAQNGALANRLAALDAGLSALKTTLDEAWRHTIVVMATEFGRTVRINGTRGTDHGTASATLLAGGALDGGKVISRWPGLRERDLHAGRDLEPTTDIRSVFKSVLIEHLGLSAKYVDKQVFPNSTDAKPLPGLTRS